MNQKQAKRLRRYVRLTFGVTDPTSYRKHYKHAKKLLNGTRRDERHVFMSLMKMMAEKSPGSASISDFAQSLYKVGQSAEKAAESFKTLVSTVDTLQKDSTKST